MTTPLAKQLEDQTAQARVEGYSWEEIQTIIGERKQKALDEGYTEKEINDAFGVKSPERLDRRLRQNADAAIAAAKPTTEAGEKPKTEGPLDAFYTGLQESSGGLIARGKLADKELTPDPGRMDRIAHSAGVLLGDIPAMTAGAVVGGAVFGGATVNPLVGAMGAGATAFALPQAIRSSYIDALKNGEIKGPGDFAERYAGVLWDTTKAAIVGGLTAGTGKVVGTTLEVAGAGAVTSVVGKTSAELAVMTTAAAGLEGHLPTPDDFIDGAILLAGFHVSNKVGSATVRIAKENLQEHWARTGESPLETAQRAVDDPVLRGQLQTEMPEPEPMGSSVTKTEAGDFVAGKIEKTPLELEIERDIETASKEAEVEAAAAPGTAPPAPGAIPPATTPGTPGADPWEVVGSRIADLKGGPTIWERVKAVGYQTYLELFNGNHPIQRLVEAYRNGQPLPDLQNPEFMYRLAEPGIVNTLSRYMIDRGMIDSKGTVTGKSLMEIVGQFERGAEDKKFWTYALSKWAVEKADQQKLTGVEIDAARSVVADAERGALKIPPTDPLDIAIRHGLPVKQFDPAIDTVRGNFGPHYDPRDNTVYMPDRPDSWYKQQYGPSLDYATVQAHEIAHALAFKWKVGGGLPKGQLRELDDEITITSRRFRPSQWKDYNQRHHVTKESELIADAIATWMTDPAARYRMPIIQSILGSKLDILGTVPKEIGNKYTRAFNDLIDWQNGTFKYLRDTGVISNDIYISAVADNRARIPGYREKEETRQTPGSGLGKTAYNPIKEFLGSDAKVENILKSIMQDAFIRVELGNRNRANVSLVDIAAKTLIDGKLQATKQVEEAREFKLTPQEMAKYKVTADADGNASIWRMIGDSVRHDEVPVFREGKLERWKFDDPDVMRVLKGYDQVQLTMWQKMAAAATRFTRGAIVLNPAFPVRMLIYDVPFQFITQPGLRNSVTGTIVGLGHVAGNTKTYDAWLRSGGADRVFGGLNRDAYIKEVLAGREDPSYTDGIWNAAKTPYHLLQGWANWLGQGQRAGRFAQGQAEGENLLRAGVMSSETQFPRPGAVGPAGKALNSVQPFMTAYLNGLEQTVRSQLGIGKTLEGKEFSAGQFTAKALALVTLPMLAQWFYSRDQEWYKAAPDWQKDNGMFIHWGGDEKGRGGTTVFVKYPPIISFMYGTIPRRLMEAFVADNPEAWRNIGLSAAASFAPPGGLLTYNVLTPLIEHVANHSFFRDRPLVSDDARKSTLAPENFTPYSSETAKVLSRAVNDLPLVKDMKLSPPVIDNYMSQWGGTLGEMLIRGSEFMLQKAGAIKADAPEQYWTDLPGIRSFFSRYPSASAQPIKDFTARLDEQKQIHNSLTKLMEVGDLARFTKLAMDNPTAVVLGQFNLSGGKGALAGTQPEKEQFVEVLRTAQRMADMDAARTIAETEKVLTGLRTLTQIVGAPNAPGRKELINTLLQSLGGRELDQEGDLTPNDKRQILDQAHAWMQVLAERGGEALNRAKKKTP